MAHTSEAPARRGRRRTAALAVALAVLVPTLAACEIVVGEDGEVRSSVASRAVDPATTQVNGIATAAIDIRMRSCQDVRLEGDDPSEVIELTLRPHAQVTDARGRVLYYSHDFPDPPQVRPPGSWEDADAGDGAHHIVVPVAGGRTPLTIRTWCDNYTPGSHGLYPKWEFPPCVTSTRRCAASTPGDGDFQLEA